jgi:hypothetical protein
MEQIPIEGRRQRKNMTAFTMEGLKKSWGGGSRSWDRGIRPLMQKTPADVSRAASIGKEISVNSSKI